ncbi:MAG: 5-amino-6-(D-ribitylamino)uracil--L-tyrosine 4-hydroxyphenyl transferase CofH [Methanomicrobiales archaeon]|jgi:FO synthase subunit 2|nr:5-amino-6-(D-ribitylamino)uracil--L-tyrosine 4-hydroxyphenyl transferase CofH [Methanomicrobiales archaeon]
MKISTILADIHAGNRLQPEDAVHLMNARGRDAHLVYAAADAIREEKVGDIVTFVRNNNIHITNICKNLCGFCGFGRRANDEDAYIFTVDQIKEQLAAAEKRHVTEICLLSGVNPEFDLNDYLELLHTCREVLPGVHIHGFSPDEINWAATQSNVSPHDVFIAMQKAGLSSLQGTGAEILVDEVRSVICPSKVSSSKWEEIIRIAHEEGFRSSATIMYGSVESVRDRITHLEVIRRIQDDTGGFTEMVLLPFIHEHTPLHKKGLISFGPTASEDLLMTAVSRLFLDNFDHIQVSLPKLGPKMAQAALCAGADDLSGTMYQDAVTEDAGGVAWCMEPDEMEYIVNDLGRTLKERTTFYEIIG